MLCNNFDFQLLLSHVALKSARAELLLFQEISKKLQNSVIAAQRETEVSRNGLEAENNSQKVLMKNLKGQLEIALQKVKITDQHLADREDTIKNLKQELEIEERKLKEVF